MFMAEKGKKNYFDLTPEERNALIEAGVLDQVSKELSEESGIGRESVDLYLSRQGKGAQIPIALSLKKAFKGRKK